MAYSRQYGTCIWRYTPDQGYFMWREFPPWSDTPGDPGGYQFSPASSSMLISRTYFLEVQHFNLTGDPPTKSTHHYDKFSTDGTHVIAAPELGSTVTIANLHKNFTQFLDPGFKTHGLALTGKILLVRGANKLAAWQLTAEGVVGDVLGDRKEDHNGRLWTKTVEDGICQGGPQRSPEVQSTLVWSSCWGATGSARCSTQRGEQRRVVRTRGNKGEVGVTRDQCRVW